MALDHFHENSPETEEDNGRMSEELVDTMGRDNEVDEATSEDRDEDGAGDDSEGAREENKEERTEANLVEPLLDELPLNHDGQNSHNTPHYPRQLYTDIARNADSLFPQSPAGQMSMSRFPSVSPGGKPIFPAYTPSDRSLPSRNVTDETLDDAYVAFILYCNPSVPLDCDTAELRKAFRLPPKSDGKTFNVHELLQLIDKLEQKQIKTWTRLAMELGVERTPDQSAQKVQQYAVRLKRWMHAMHIDAYFEYCLGKPHSYFTQIPMGSENGPTEIRDGVPLEEDLALRALHPENRPKRGRRKTEDRNDDGSDREMPPTKRPLLDTSTPTISRPPADHFGTLYPNSAVPNSAENDGIDRYMGEGSTSDPWSTTAAAIVGGNSSTSATPGHQFRWRAFSREGTTPQQQTPSSALSIDTAQDDIITPISATPTSGPKRPRRRHGPAVSSAWPSSGNPLTGKLRGRPPSNRSVRDGPFSTFPANPQGRNGVTVDLGPGAAGTPTSTPIVQTNPQPFPFSQNSRPQNLQLQVPQRQPSLVTVATPILPRTNGSKVGVGYQDLERKLAANLLQAVSTDLGIEDATNLAQRAIADLVKSPDPAAISAIRVFLGCDESTSALVKEFKVRRLPAPPSTSSNDLSTEDEKYVISWKISVGALRGEFSQVVSIGGNRHSISELHHDMLDRDIDDMGIHGIDALDDESFGITRVEENRVPAVGSSEVPGDANSNGQANDWKRKYYMMERKLRDKENEIAMMKRRVIDAVM